MLKLPQPKLNSQIVEAVTLRARTSRGGVFPSPTTAICQAVPDTIQDLKFVKVVIMGCRGPPFGPRAVLLEDWLSNKTDLAVWVCPSSDLVDKYDVDRTAGLMVQRKNLFPVPARTIAEDVKRVSNIVLESSKAHALREQIAKLEQKQIALEATSQEYITNWTLALLTGRLPSIKLASERKCYHDQTSSTPTIRPVNH